MIRLPTLVLAALFASLPATAADQATPVPEDYAKGYVLTGGEGSVRYLLLDEKRYRDMASDDASDIAVFNAAGKQLPHRIEGQQKGLEKSRTLSLPFFPVLDETVEGAASFWQYEQDQQSFELRYRTWQEKREQSPQEAVSYILKNENTDDRLTKLTINWSQQQTSMIGAMKVENGNDMTSWSPLVSRAVLSRLTHEGSTLQQDEIKLGPTQAKYLRLSWIGGNPGITINEILAEYSTTPDGDAQQWIELDPVTPIEDEEDAYLFDTGGPMPVRQLAFAIPHDGLYYRGKLYSRMTEEQEWRHRAAINQYRLQREGLTTESSPIDLPDVQDRHWKIVLEQPLNLQAQDYPQIRVRLQPQRLVFLAQGEEPYTLAIGSRQVEPQSFSLPDHKLPEDFSVETSAQVTLGEEVMLGGEEQLQAPKKKADLKTWLLWAVLVLGVLVMGWMARGLLREMKQ
jgi:hypothetical protein